MESKVNFAVVGAFVLIFCTLLIGAVLWLSSEKSYGKTYDTYLVYMNESVSGLTVDAPVRYRGVDVGSVRSIQLAPGNVEQVLLTLQIEHGTPVKEDTKAVLRVQGLTGIAHVELSGGSRDSPPLKRAHGEKYPVIGTGPSLMVRLDTAFTTLLANLNRSSERINALLDDENRVVLRQTLDNLERLSRTLVDGTGKIDASLNQATRAMKSTAQAMDNTARLAELANKEMPQLLARIQRSADAFDKMTSETARAGSTAANTMESVRAEALPEARQAIAELRELTASLQRFSEGLERNPGMLLQGKPAVPPGPGE